MSEQAVLLGGWTAYHKLSAKDQAVFNQALKGFVGGSTFPLKSPPRWWLAPTTASSARALCRLPNRSMAKPWCRSSSLWMVQPISSPYIRSNAVGCNEIAPLLFLAQKPLCKRCNALRLLHPTSFCQSARVAMPRQSNNRGNFCPDSANAPALYRGTLVRRGLIVC